VREETSVHKTYLLAERILFRADALVIILKSLLQGSGRKTEFLGQCLSRLEALHQSSAYVMLAVPLDLFGRLAIENKSDGILSTLRQ
jgi:hypothetical protein